MWFILLDGRKVDSQPRTDPHPWPTKKQTFQGAGEQRLAGRLQRLEPAASTWGQSQGGGHWAWVVLHGLPIWRHRGVRCHYMSSETCTARELCKSRVKRNNKVPELKRQGNFPPLPSASTMRHRSHTEKTTQSLVHPH